MLPYAETPNSQKVTLKERWDQIPTFSKAAFLAGIAISILVVIGVIAQQGFLGHGAHQLIVKPVSGWTLSITGGLSALAVVSGFLLFKRKNRTVERNDLKWVESIKLPEWNSPDAPYSVDWLNKIDLGKTEKSIEMRAKKRRTIIKTISSIGAAVLMVVALGVMTHVAHHGHFGVTAQKIVDTKIIHALKGAVPLWSHGVTAGVTAVITGVVLKIFLPLKRRQEGNQMINALYEQERIIAESDHQDRTSLEEKV